VDGQVAALLVQNLERLDESVREEADGVHNTLGEGLAPINNQMGFGFFFSPILQSCLLKMKTHVCISCNYSFDLVYRQ
jgi:beta-catenin-like protein 1